jgi:hypothetical protein
MNPLNLTALNPLLNTNMAALSQLSQNVAFSPNFLQNPTAFTYMPHGFALNTIPNINSNSNVNLQSNNTTNNITTSGINTTASNTNHNASASVNQKGA